MIHAKTQSLLDSFIANPSSSLMLIGSEEFGVHQCQEYLTSKLLSKSNLSNQLLVEPDKGASLTIEQARELKKSLATTANTGNATSRIAIIKKFQTATIEAQNALLKLIEEPVANTVILLQADSTDTILDTILSRTQHIPILPLAKEQVAEYLETLGKKSELEKIYQISQGASEIVKALATDSDSTVLENIENVKKFIQNRPFERISIQKQYEEAAELNMLINTIERIASAGLHSSTPAGQTKWISLLKEVRNIKRLQKHNVNQKLLYLRLCVSI